MKEIEERLLKALGLIVLTISIMSIILMFIDGGPITFQDFLSSINLPFIAIWFVLFMAALKDKNLKNTTKNKEEE